MDCSGYLEYLVILVAAALAKSAAPLAIAGLLAAARAIK
jgi:hypothetical protein